MENLISHSIDSINSNENFIISNIYFTEKEVEEDINKLQKQISFETISLISNLCEKIKKKIIYYKDEQLLTKTQNDSRRISIASNLMFGLCILLENIIEFECNNIVFQMLDAQMLTKISNKIVRKKRFLLEQEKYFFQQAEMKLLKNAEDDSAFESEGNHKNGSEEQSPKKNKESLETEVQSPMYHDIENATELRNITQDSNFQFDTINPFKETGDTYINLEASIKDFQSQILEDMRQISDILEDQDTIEPRMPEVPERSLEINRKASTVLQKNEDKVTNGEKRENNLAEIEIMEEEKWSLTYIEPIEPKLKKKRKSLIIDKNTVIPNYALRALNLNKNINIQRIQVYEGPPNILDSMSLSHLMKNPSFPASLFPERRNSKLNLLYQRHLLTEKSFQARPSMKRKFMEVHQTKQILEPQKSFEEELGAPMKISKVLHAKDSLKEISPEYNLQEQYNLEAFTSFGADLERESLIGQPLSRIVQPIIPSPEIEHINTDVPLPNGRVHQLKGQRDDTSLISFQLYNGEKNPPPNEKWREFNFVISKLEEIWSLLEQRNQVKEINAKDLLSFEKDRNVASLLTLLRILDKLSLQRKLVLKVSNGDIFIRPFETPYVSSKAFMLKDEKPKF